MNKKRLFKYATILLAITIVTCFLTSTTLAGLHGQKGGNGTARIAKLDLDTGVNGEQVVDGKVDMFATGNNVSGYKTSDAAGNIIAPGGTGTIEFLFVNSGEVDFTVQMETLTFSDNSLKLPFYFSITVSDTTYNYSNVYDAQSQTTLGSGDDVVTLSGTIADLKAKINEVLAARGTVAYSKGTDGEELSTYSASVTVNWTWSFSEALDSSTITEELQTIGLTFAVKATQVKPTVA